MKPKKTLIEAAQKDGSMARLNQLLSASHILLLFKLPMPISRNLLP